MLRKTVKPGHELFSPPGCCADEVVLAEAERSGYIGIVIERERDGTILWAPLSKWRHGIYINRGFGPQRCLLWRELVPVSVQDEPSAPEAQPSPRVEQVMLL